MDQLGNLPGRRPGHKRRVRRRSLVHTYFDPQNSGKATPDNASTVAGGVMYNINDKLQLPRWRHRAVRLRSPGIARNEARCSTTVDVSGHLLRHPSRRE